MLGFELEVDVEVDASPASGAGLPGVNPDGGFSFGGRWKEADARAARAVCSKKPAAARGVDDSAALSFFALSRCRRDAERVMRPPRGIGPNLAP